LKEKLLDPPYQEVAGAVVAVAPSMRVGPDPYARRGRLKAQDDNNIHSVSVLVVAELLPFWKGWTVFAP
jgi:hypothetical protein